MTHRLPHLGAALLRTPILALVLSPLLGCASTAPSRATPKDPTMTKSPQTDPGPVVPGSFADDCAFIARHTPLIVLKSADQAAQIAIAPGYQGRVMTSTATGPRGPGYGYVHRAGISAGERQRHITVLGGEDRFWVGPEGGQYALYFAPGSSFDFDHWQVPEPIDWGAWPVTAQDERSVTFQQDMGLTNYAGTRFTLRVEREIRLLDVSAVSRVLGAAPGPSLGVVGYESVNTLENRGSAPLRKETGLVSIWILGMFKPAPRVTVVIPYIDGPAAERGPVVTDAYFGAIDPQRLVVGKRAVFFRGDGKQRGKIGLPRLRARDVAGSYDPDSRTLTLVQYSLPEEPSLYVSSLWQQQSNPYAGDVVNAFNDGPPAEGAAPLGPFYEIESSSPAAELAHGQRIRHVHRTLHLQGADAELDAVARKVLGVSIAEINSALP